MSDLALLQEAVAQETAKTRFSGVVLVEHDGTPVIREARGYANRSDLVPNGMDTRFGIASGCKIFTAAAVCQLIEQGALSLDQTIGDLLDAPLGRIDPAITIRQLLTHTSGIRACRTSCT